MKQKEISFSLKDQLFNKESVEYLGTLLFAADKKFNKSNFIHDVLKKFPELELKARIMHIRDMLQRYLSTDYRSALEHILRALPQELDPQKTDDDFGQFIIAPLGYYVVAFGCTKEHLKISLHALSEITKRFSMEGPVRFFINAFPEETFSFFQKHIKNSNYHVRRWISESTRPYLPWEIRLCTNYQKPLVFLDTLYQDKTRYVVRSVANHLNDISKIDPELVIQKLVQWQQEKKQSDTEMKYLVHHALRTLIKKGDSKALACIGFSSREIPETITCILGSTKIVQGSDMSFEVSLVNSSEQKVLVAYAIHFLQKSGKHYKKVFKIGSYILTESVPITISKKHSFKAISTRTYYPGEHFFELFINGQSVYTQAFDLS